MYKIVKSIRTLEQYSKKYPHYKTTLLWYSLKEVKEFDELVKLEEKNFLLKNRKWAFIDNVYYEVPKTFRFVWFRNLNAGLQTMTCLLGAGVIATGITVPTYLLLNRSSDKKEEQVDNLETSFVEKQRKVYRVKETIKKTDLKIIATLPDKSTKEITDWHCDDFNSQGEYTFTAADLAAGSKTFKIKYGGKTCDYKINVTEEFTGKIKDKLRWKEAFEFLYTKDENMNMSVNASTGVGEGKIDFYGYESKTTEEERFIYDLRLHNIDGTFEIYKYKSETKNEEIYYLDFLESRFPCEQAFSVITSYVKDLDPENESEVVYDKDKKQYNVVGVQGIENGYVKFADYLGNNAVEVINFTITKWGISFNYKIKYGAVKEFNKPSEEKIINMNTSNLEIDLKKFISKELKPDLNAEEICCAASFDFSKATNFNKDKKVKFSLVDNDDQKPVDFGGYQLLIDGKLQTSENSRNDVSSYIELNGDIFENAKDVVFLADSLQSPTESLQLICEYNVE